MTAGNEIRAAKRRLRGEAKMRRAAIAGGAHAAQAAVAQFGESPWAAVSGLIVSGYWPLADELDPRPLTQALAKQGAKLALPVVAGKDRPLEFRFWDGAPPQARDIANIPCPPPEVGAVRPDLLLAPLLLVDAGGHRLGYGAGYYDRTIRELRASVIAIGLGFDAQRVQRLPTTANDMELDGLVTEAGWYVFKKTGGAW